MEAEPELTASTSASAPERSEMETQPSSDEVKELSAVASEMLLFSEQKYRHMCDVYKSISERLTEIMAAMIENLPEENAKIRAKVNELYNEFQRRQEDIARISHQLDLKGKLCEETVNKMQCYMGAKNISDPKEMPTEQNVCEENIPNITDTKEIQYLMEAKNFFFDPEEEITAENNICEGNAPTITDTEETKCDMEEKKVYDPEERIPTEKNVCEENVPTITGTEETKCEMEAKNVPDLHQEIPAPKIACEGHDQSVTAETQREMELENVSTLNQEIPVEKVVCEEHVLTVADTKEIQREMEMENVSELNQEIPIEKNVCEKDATTITETLEIQKSQDFTMTVIKMKQNLLNIMNCQMQSGILEFFSLCAPREEATNEPNVPKTNKEMELENLREQLHDILKTLLELNDKPTTEYLLELEKLMKNQH